MSRCRLSGPRWVLFVACLALCTAQSCFTAPSNRPQYLGVYSTDATISSVGGVLVTGIVPSGAADVAGIRANDILARMDDKVIGGVTDIRQKIAAKTLGQSAAFVFFRSTDENPGAVAVPLGPNAAGSLPNVLGFAVSAGTASALKVIALQTGGVAALAGLKVNDLISSVNSTPTTTLNDAWRVFAPLDSSSTVTVHYTRPGVPNLSSTGVDLGYDLQLKAGADAASWIAVPGLYVQDLTPTLAAHFNYISTTGAQITNIYRDSPAFTARLGEGSSPVSGGLMVGDIIIQLTPLDNSDGVKAVSSSSVLSSLVTTYAGQSVRLRYLRGQLPPANLDLTLSGVPSDAAQVPAIGMLLEQLYDSSNAPAGVRVEQVTTGGPAATAGINRDERVTLVNATSITTIAGFWSALLADYDTGNLNVVLQITPTAGSPRYVVLKLTVPT